MIKIEVNAPKLPDLKQKMRTFKTKLTIGQKMYLRKLMGSGAVSVEAKLKQKLLSLLYQDSEPDYYERTMSLLEATRAEMEGNQIHLYIDDEWLDQQPHVQEQNMRHGYAYNARAGARTPYSMRVEEDFDYRHRPGGSSAGEFTVRRSGTQYMKNTFDAILEDIKSGDKQPKEILKPIIGDWS